MIFNLKLKIDYATIFAIGTLILKILKPSLKTTDRQEKLLKLYKLKSYQDLEFAEVGINDGL